MNELDSMTVKNIDFKKNNSLGIFKTTMREFFTSEIFLELIKIYTEGLKNDQFFNIDKLVDFFCELNKKIKIKNFNEFKKEREHKKIFYLNFYNDEIEFNENTTTIFINKFYELSNEPGKDISFELSDLNLKVIPDFDNYENDFLYLLPNCTLIIEKEFPYPIVKSINYHSDLNIDIDIVNMICYLLFSFRSFDSYKIYDYQSFKSIFLYNKYYYREFLYDNIYNSDVYETIVSIIDKMGNDVDNDRRNNVENGRSNDRGNNVENGVGNGVGNNVGNNVENGRGNNVENDRGNSKENSKKKNKNVEKQNNIFNKFLNKKR